MLAVALLAATSFCTFAKAETVLRLDESPVGELDPAKASDYADSVLMFNVYDTLVIPKPGQPGYDLILREDGPEILLFPGTCMLCGVKHADLRS